ncbi:MAG: hypothetical protein ACP5IC_00880 [Minisyncoccia bacterium]
MFLVIAYGIYHRFQEFLRNWYIKSFYLFFGKIINLLQTLDKTFAVKINFKFLLYPLYGDYSIVGRILGFLFRVFKIVSGIIIYGLIILLAAFVYILWLMTPIYFLYRIFV